MSTVICSDASWPLATVSFHGNLREEDFDAYLRFLHVCHLRRNVWVLLLDGTNVRGMTPLQRQKMADFLRDHEELARQYCAGTAFVLDSPLVRGMLTAIFWFQRQPTPYVIVGKRAQALAWLKSQAEKYGAHMPALEQRLA